MCAEMRLYMARRGKEITTYEYFKVDEVFFWGKHKDYIDKLWKAC